MSEEELIALLRDWNEYDEGKINDAREAAAARIEELSNCVAVLEAKLRKLEQWFDTDQEILDVMGNNEKADHMRQLKMIRDALIGGKDA